MQEERFIFVIISIAYKVSFAYRFKNLVRQYQSMYPSLTVDVDAQLKKLKVGTDSY